MKVSVKNDEEEVTKKGNEQKRQAGVIQVGWNRNRSLIHSSLINEGDVSSKPLIHDEQLPNWHCCWSILL